MEFRLQQRGCRIFCLWLALAGLLIGSVLCWLWLIVGLVVCSLWFALCLYLFFIWCPSVKIYASRDELMIQAGCLFPLCKRIPLRCLSGLIRYSSPLMRRADCCLLLFFASTGLFAPLPGLSCPDADRLCALLREG